MQPVQAVQQAERLRVRNTAVSEVSRVRARPCRTFRPDSDTEERRRQYHGASARRAADACGDHGGEPEKGKQMKIIDDYIHAAFRDPPKTETGLMMLFVAYEMLRVGDYA